MSHRFAQTPQLPPSRPNAPPAAGMPDEAPTQAEIDNYIRLSNDLPPDGSAGNAAVRWLIAELRQARLAALQLLEREQQGFSGPRERGSWNQDRNAAIEFFKKQLY